MPDSLHPAHERIDPDRIEADLMAVLAIASPSLHEAEVVEWAVSALCELGLEPEVDAAAQTIGGEAGNVIARVAGTGDDAPPLLVNAHLDTVVPCEGVQPVLSDGVIRSAGNTVLGGDDKCGVVAILAALRALHACDWPCGPLEVVFTVAEEIGLLGAKALACSQFAARHALVLDGGHLIGKITVSAPTHDRLDFVVHGRAAHAAVAPDKGVHAIQVASQAILAAPHGRVNEQTTANVGIISGGRATNIIPDRVEVAAEVRSRDPESLERVKTQYRSCFETAAIGAGATVECTDLRHYYGFVVPPESRIRRHCEAASAALGLPAISQDGAGGSDANIFNEHGIETVIANCGQREPHSTDEHLHVADVVQAAHFALEVIQQFAGDTV